MLAPDAVGAQYQLSYDFRAHKRLASRKDEAAVSSAKGVVELQSSAHLASFIPQRQPATVDHFRQLLKQREQQQQGADPKEESSSGGIGEKGSGSKFDMKAAMKGAQVSEQVSTGMAAAHCSWTAEPRCLPCLQACCQGALLGEHSPS
jgi:hypothetical protein